MTFEIPQFLPAVPELFLLGMICFILVVDVFLSDAHRLVTYWLSLATVAGTAWLTVWVSARSTSLNAIVPEVVSVPLSLVCVMVPVAVVAVLMVGAPLVPMTEIQDGR